MFILVYGTISSNNSTLQISNFHPFLFDAINKTEYVIFYGLVDIEESKYIYIVPSTVAITMNIVD